MAAAGANIFGVALNNVDLRKGGTYYRYYAYEREEEDIKQD